MVWRSMLTLTPTFDGKRTIPSRAVTSLMLEMLALTPSDKVLEIGTGSATQTHALAESGAEIHSIELEPYVDTTIPIGDYIFLHHGDGRKGLPKCAPFTAIMATCGVKSIPQTWIDQLSESGRIIVPIGDVHVQKLTLFRKEQGQLVAERIGAYTRFQMLREVV